MQKIKVIILVLFITNIIAGCADVDYAVKGYRVEVLNDLDGPITNYDQVNVVFDQNPNQLPMCINSKPLALVSVPTYDLWGNLYDMQTITTYFKNAAISVNANFIVDITSGVNSGDGSLMLSGYAIKC